MSHQTEYRKQRERKNYDPHFILKSKEIFQMMAVKFRYYLFHVNFVVISHICQCGRAGD